MRVGRRGRHRRRGGWRRWRWRTARKEGDKQRPRNKIERADGSGRQGEEDEGGEKGPTNELSGDTRKALDECGEQTVRGPGGVSPAKGRGQGAEEREVQEGPCSFLHPPIVQQYHLSEGQNPRGNKPTPSLPCVGEQHGESNGHTPKINEHQVADGGWQREGDSEKGGPRSGRGAPKLGECDAKDDNE